ncbi:TetR/AcrR family transcriptional regulator [Virgibacillus halodenitrificans]|uniref:TetR/AcrR family transcriptional regulator n=1 Tax=Virgibacillus halodenitrificans TaxID=1482 RepID=UPI001F428E64|nr:TetR/AcrR family transcriptional regulator [Virgibacillus halodenitrificans]
MAKPKSYLKEEQIFQAALKLFSENGFSKTTIKEIAQEADVSFGTVFTYFDTKESLFYACVARPLEEVKERFLLPREFLEELTIDSLKRMVAEHIHYFWEQESYIRLIQYVIGQPQRFSEMKLLDEFAEEFILFIEDVVLKGMKKGFLPESDPTEVGYGYLAFLNGARLTYTDKANVRLTNAFEKQALRLFGINKWEE